MFVAQFEGLDIFLQRSRHFLIIYKRSYNSIFGIIVQSFYVTSMTLNQFFRYFIAPLIIARVLTFNVTQVQEVPFPNFYSNPLWYPTQHSKVKTCRIVSSPLHFFFDIDNNKN